MSVESELNKLTAATAAYIEQAMALDTRIRDVFASIQASTGVTAFETKAQMVSAPDIAEGAQARVWDDEPNNGLYLFKNGTWDLDAGFYSQLAADIQPMLDSANAAVVEAEAAVVAAQQFSPQTLNLPAGSPPYDMWNKHGQSALLVVPTATGTGLPAGVVSADTRVAKQRLYETALFCNNSSVWGTRSNADVTASPFLMTMVHGAAGNIHACAEGRLNPGGDTAGMVILEALSPDNGKTWTHTGRTLVKDYHTDGSISRLCNPSLTYVPSLGRTWLVFSRAAPAATSSSLQLCAIYRLDSDGKWYGPNGEFVPGSDCTNTFKLNSLKQATWSRILSGPGAGDVGTDGNVYFPFWYEHPQFETYGTGVARLNADGTATLIWAGGLFYDIVGEPTLVALENGKLQLNCRQRGTAYYARHILEIAVSGDTGTISNHWIDDYLIDPHCEGSQCRLTGKGDGKPSRVLFVNCADTTNRVRLTARLSYREGAKHSYSTPAPLWPDTELVTTDILGGALASPVIINHTAGYSACCPAGDGLFAVLAQKNTVRPGGAVNTGECLVFSVFSVGNAL